MGLNLAPNGLQALKFTTLHSFSPEKKNSPPHVIFSSSSYVFALCGSNSPALTYKSLNKSPSPFSLIKCSCSKLRQGCCRSLGRECGSSRELPSQTELAEQVDGSNSADTACVVSDVSRNSVPVLSSKMDFLEPSLLGVWPEPPDWPERDEIARIGIEMKANSVQIPLSRRMIKTKHQQEQIGFVEGGAMRNCSIKKAFSSMVFMVREIQSSALHIREGLYSEDLGDAEKKMEREINASFVWLFRQVFSQTPQFMVLVMVLLSNLCVCSMNGSIVSAPESVQRLSSEILDENGREQLTGFVSDEKLVFSSPANHGLSDEEAALWSSLLEEVVRMKSHDAEAIKRFFVPVTVEVEKDDHEEYSRTDLLYQINLALDPYNLLLLSNYAQFLYLIRRDYSRAHECFKRAIKAVPPDAEALCRYADFLWIVRKDTWGAEEGYRQAIAAEPENPYYASKYANFLWNNGGEETC